MKNNYVYNFIFSNVLKFILIFLYTLFMIGCDDSKSSGILKVGVISGQEADVMQKAIEISKRDFDLNAKLVEFSDYISPNLALNDGSIDVNAFQHKPYLNKVMRDRGFNFVVVGTTFLYPLAAYSKKIQKISDLQPGAKIAIPNDPTNGARALILLHNHSLIKVTNPEDLNTNLADIDENPHNYKFIELDAAQLPRSLADVDLAIINSSFSVPYGFIPNKNGLLVEDSNSPYVNLIVVKDGNENDSRIQKLIQAYQTEEIANFAKKIFSGAAIPGWE